MLIQDAVLILFSLKSISSTIECTYFSELLWCHVHYSYYVSFTLLKCKALRSRVSVPQQNSPNTWNLPDNQYRLCCCSASSSDYSFLRSTSDDVFLWASVHPYYNPLEFIHILNYPFHSVFIARFLLTQRESFTIVF